jgi:hypothetical protein
VVVDVEYLVIGGVGVSVFTSIWDRLGDILGLDEWLGLDE